MWELAPEAAAETPEAVLTEIALELELTGNRVVRLAARLREVSAQRPSPPMGRGGLGWLGWNAAQWSDGARASGEHARSSAIQTQAPA